MAKETVLSWFESTVTQGWFPEHIISIPISIHWLGDMFPYKYLYVYICVIDNI